MTSRATLVPFLRPIECWLAHQPCDPWAECDPSNNGCANQVPNFPPIKFLGLYNHDATIAHLYERDERTLPQRLSLPITNSTVCLAIFLNCFSSPNARSSTASPRVTVT